MGIELGRCSLQAAVMAEVGFQRFIQAGLVAFIVSQ